jgi:Bifunctional DNA primase/polymerase, N-terminal
MLPLYMAYPHPACQEQIPGKLIPLHIPVFEGGQLVGCSCGNHCPQKSWGKHPRIADWQRKASVRPNQIAAWTGMYQPLNWGVNPSDRCHILDVDDPSAAQALDLPPTFTVTTGRGRHFYFEVPRGALKGSPRLCPGIDTRGPNGYVLAAGSLHQSGRRYEIECDLPLAPMPSQILEQLMRRDCEPMTQEGREEERVAAPPLDRAHSETRRLILEGGPDRSSALASVYCSLIRAGYSDAEIAAICWDEAHKISEKPRERGWKWLCKDIATVKSRMNSRFTMSDLLRAA